MMNAEGAGTGDVGVILLSLKMVLGVIFAASHPRHINYSQQPLECHGVLAAAWS